jgi:hypothetical protein
MTRGTAFARFAPRARRVAAAACACLASCAALAAAPGPCRIEGTIAPAGAVVRVSAIDRNVKTGLTPKEVPVKEHPGTLLSGGAGYSIAVPPGEYDIHVELPDGSLVEGADMRVDAPSDAKPLTAEDRAAIEKRVMAMRTFENEKEVLEIAGAGTVACAIVKLLRTNPTSYDGEFGEPVAIFRWELWEFRKQTGSWVKDRTVRVLRRYLIAKRAMDTMKWSFTGSLGGISVAPGATVVRAIDLSAGPAGQAPRTGAEP